MTSFAKILAALMLSTMFSLALFSSWQESAIFDETAHIGAGYSYLTQKDMRLNPEHPPLIKDLAAIPLLFLNLNFPTNTDAWQNQINGQWDQGGGFLFDFGNNADKILHYARLPIMLLSLLTGLVFFLWSKKLFGSRVALLALFFFAFSPTVIAHSRYVTTDIAATFGFLIGLVAFIGFIQHPSRQRLIVAGIAFGISQVLKFSLFLLVPIFLILGAFWLLADEEIWEHKNRLKLLLKKAIKLYFKIGIIFLIGFAIVYGVYVWHTWNYPQARELRDASSIISGFRPHSFVTLDLWLIGHNATRPLGQYLLGLMMVAQRTAGGNSAYFSGQVSSSGWYEYFPTLYLLKETLAFHILTILALGLAIGKIFRAREKSFFALRVWLRNNFPIFASIFFIAFYWASSVSNPLNIGIRHVLPTFPFIYMLVARELVIWISGPKLHEVRSFRDIFFALAKKIFAPLPKIFLVGLAVAWIALNILAAFPYYLSYYNELAGGSANGYYYATDSNYDWGQDLKRLAYKTVDFPGKKIYLDYFGGSTSSNGAQRYWLGDRYMPWYSSYGQPPSGSIFAVSANSLMGSQAQAVKGFPAPKPEDTYSWLRALKPIDRAGISILIYRIP